MDAKSVSKCSRASVFNSYCARADAESHWGATPPGEEGDDAEGGDKGGKKAKPKPVPNFLPLPTLLRLRVSMRRCCLGAMVVLTRK